MTTSPPQDGQWATGPGTHEEELRSVALLTTDPGYRARFLAAGCPGFDPAEVERVGRVYAHHRRLRVEEHLRWVDLPLRPDLMPLLERFAATVPAGFLNRDEAIAFCRFVEREPPVVAPYLPDLARLDRLRLSIAWGLAAEGGQGGAHSAEISSAWPLLDIVARLEEPGWPRVEPRRTQLLIKKVPSMPAVVVRERPPDPTVL